MFKRKNGSTFYGLVSANNLYDEDGNLVGSNTIIKDITDLYNARKNIEEKNAQLEEQLEQIRRINNEKDEFIHMLSSELRSASIHINKRVNILLSKDISMPNGMQLEKLEEIKLKSESTTKMLSDISDCFKIEHSTFMLNVNQWNLSQVMYDVISGLEKDAASRACTITADLQENVSCTFDKDRIKQVLVQLLTNAISFSPKKSGNIHVKMRCPDLYAKISIKDNGIGIRKQNLDRIFEKFYQIDTSVLREHQGAGLGLYICKTIVEAHNGKIWVESGGTDEGTEIHILLPLFIKNNTVMKKI